MEITPVQFVDIRLINESGNNEPAHFKGIIESCIKEAIKPGFKNMFTPDEKKLLADIAKGIGLEVDEQLFVILAADTHTQT